MKDSIISQKLCSCDCWWIANSVLNNGVSAIPPLFNCSEVLSSVSGKVKLFTEKLSKNINLYYSGISLPVFPSRTNLKMPDVNVTPKLVKEVITNVDLSNASGPDCIPVVVLMNCKSLLLYMLAQLFNMNVKESCFQDCYKVVSVVPVFKGSVKW